MISSWQALRASVVTACGVPSPIVATDAVLPAYAEMLATFGAGTFDDFLSVLPPVHLQTWADRMGNLMEADGMPAALRDLIVFAEDIDGRMFGYGADGLVIADGFDAVPVGDLVSLVARSLDAEGRRRSWFRPAGKHVLAHAEALLANADTSLDAWASSLGEGDDARLLASLDAGARIRELHLPALDGVLRLQVVGPRCSLRLSLPHGADAPVALRSLNAPAPWRALVESARTTVLG